MGLFANVIGGAIVIVIIAAAIIFLGGGRLQGTTKLNATAAENFIIGYAKQVYPNTEVHLINVSRSQLQNSSWDVFFGVINNYTRACPVIQIQDVDYPAENIQPRIDNVYSCTSNTIVNLEGMNLPAAAMIDAYILSPRARAYVSDFGYNNVTVSANYFRGFTMNSTVLNNVWAINYTAQAAHYYETVVLNQSGVMLGNYSVIPAAH